MTSASATSNVAVVGRWIDEVVNGRDVDACYEIFAPDYVGHSPPHAEPEPVRGPEGYRRFVSGILNGFPDAYAVVDLTVSDGDHVAARVTMRGTHLGKYRGIPPTGRRFEISQIVILRIRDGRIAESWQEIDALGLMHQLGLVPPATGGPVGLLRWTFSTIVHMARLEIASARARPGRPTG